MGENIFLLEQNYSVWTSVLFFCFFVLRDCDFPLAHFWSVRVTGSAEKAKMLSREKPEETCGTQSKIVCFCQSPFLSGIEN